MAWIEPRTWISGELVSAAHLNQELRHNPNAIGRPEYFRSSVCLQAGTAIANNTVQALTWGTEAFDTAGWHAASASTIVADAKRIVVARLTTEWAAKAGATNWVESRLDWNLALAPGTFRYVEGRSKPDPGTIWWARVVSIAEMEPGDSFLGAVHQVSGETRVLTSARIEVCSLGVAA